MQLLKRYLNSQLCTSATTVPDPRSLETTFNDLCPTGMHIAPTEMSPLSGLISHRQAQNPHKALALGTWHSDSIGEMRLLFGVLLFLSTAFATQQVQTRRCRPLCENAKSGEVCIHFESRLATFSDAQNVCRSKGGQLTSIQNVYENLIISRKVFTWSQKVVFTNVFWIGGVWSNGWKWIDGKPMTYQNFADGLVHIDSPPATHIDPHEPVYKCLSMVAAHAWTLNGLWIPTYCTGLAPFVCEIRKSEVFPPTLSPTTTPSSTTSTTTTATTTTRTTTEATTTTTTEISTTASTTTSAETTNTSPPTTTTTTAKPTTTTTPAPTTTTSEAATTTLPTTNATKPSICEGWNRHCYRNHLYIYNHRKLTWHKAEEYCVSQKGHLTSILSAEETEFIAYVIRAANLKEDVWLGAYRVKDTFIWLDGSKWDYTNFNKEQPNVTGGNDCLEIFDASYKKWANYDCTREYPSICKIPI
ncbi:hypothetical protein QR680_006022 [Steinernema hermaphroditum]|uniref:C-type lectin domain-containing protein n=1 Tax=Steinernema hermaphroditum TaxID=289476 RepID=A0AA39HVE3_9BILA|nr:hypothetical protein QR680_006022 [Steinernema hermaphroditum]